MRSRATVRPLDQSRKAAINLLAVVIVQFLIVVSAAAPSGRQRNLKAPSSHSLGGINAEVIGEAEQRLSELGYWIGPRDGVFDAEDRQALIAFQKVESRKRTGRLTIDDVKALRAAARPTPLETGYQHLEVDLSRQVLYTVGASGEVSGILPVSTGSGKPFTIKGRREVAVTPTGKFRVYHKIAGWRKSPLGLLYYPNYISGGIAIHGNPSVPVYAASHGCIRIPMYASAEFSKKTPIGTIVIVHDGGSY